MVTDILSYAMRYGMFPEGLVLACVSGGADSMAMLTALLELAPSCGFTIQVAHFDHRLRGAESDRDREFVSDYCKKLAVACHIGSGDTRAYASKHKLGIEESARELRYMFFHELRVNLGALRIATAHTLDDNAETVLLNLARGSGTRGLSGIPPVRGDIIRPLLCVSREEIEAFLHARGVPYIVDSTNLSDEYARNKIRLYVSPVMQRLNSSYSRHVLEAGELLRCDDEYLNSLAEDFLKLHGSRVPVLPLSKLPKAVAARVLFSLSKGSLSFYHTDKVLDLCRNEHGSKAVETSAGVFIREYDNLLFKKMLINQTFSEVAIAAGVDAEISELGLKISCRAVDSGLDGAEFYEKCQKNNDDINKSFNYFVFKKAEICGRIIVRPRQEGDFINILGRGVSKSLKKLFIENKIPKRERGLIPVIADDIGPLAVYGICVGTRALPAKGESAIEISLVRAVDA